MYENYSVLMSVYAKEKPEHLRDSMESIYAQTVPTDDFILVCDGPLTYCLNLTIYEMQRKFGNRLRVLRLQKNSGLGNALNTGLKSCKNNLVARIDSDDIRIADSCEKQIREFERNPSLSIVSGLVEEFEGTIKTIKGKRVVPSRNVEIIRFSKKRNPFNHPAVMFKKESVITSGSYDERFHLFEDYYLWLRMIHKGYIGYNIPELLLYMRTSRDTYNRRSGFSYAKELLRLRLLMFDKGWINRLECYTDIILRLLVYILPNIFVRNIYRLIHK